MSAERYPVRLKHDEGDGHDVPAKLPLVLQWFQQHPSTKHDPEMVVIPVDATQQQLCN